MEFIRFILSGFWTWAGFLILLVAAGAADDTGVGV